MVESEGPDKGVVLLDLYRALSVEKPDTDEDGGGGDCAKAAEARSGGDSQE
jgi:hypothetical protein